ncbi:MAG: Ig-like domain-containing protein, partial [Gemmatimonadales bacterium]
MNRLRLWICAGVLSCGGGGTVAPPPPPSPPTPVASVEVSAATATLVPSATAQLSATPRDAGGNALLGRSVSWASSAQAVATVSATGLVTGVTPGSATISATVEGKTGQAAVTVKEGMLIGPAGGTLVAAGGDVTLVVPAGAVSQPTAFTVEPLTNPAPDPRLIGATAYEIGPTGTVFAQPATLAIRYAPANLPQGLGEAALQIFTGASGAWAVVPGGTVDTATNVAQAPLAHLSPNAIFAPSASPTALAVYPNGDTPPPQIDPAKLNGLVEVRICVGKTADIIVASYAPAGLLNPSYSTGWSPSAQTAGSVVGVSGPRAGTYNLFSLLGMTPGTTFVRFVLGSASVTLKVTVKPCGKVALASDKNGSNDEIYVYAENPDDDDDDDDDDIRFGTGAAAKLTAAVLTGETRLTNHPARDFFPAISKDGKKIAFVSDRDGDNEIFIINIDGTGLTQLTNNTTDDQFPSFSPLGPIVFSS